MIYKKNIIISGSLCGNETKLSRLGAMQLIEDAITEMMGILKIDGVTSQREYNAMWVFSKNKILFYNEIDWGTEIQIECFISFKSLVKFYVDTLIKTLHGTICVHSRAEVCGVDLQTGKIRKIETIGIDNSIVVEQSPQEIKFERIFSEECKQIDKVKVRSTNIDFCHHTNNKEYIRFLLNTYSVTELLNNPIKAIQIDYVNQSFEGENLVIYRLSLNNIDTFKITNKDKIIIFAKIIK